MKTFIGVKIIDAQPMTKHGFLNKIKNEDVSSGEANLPGYHVVYPDGYESWSPKEAFEEAYRETTEGCMTFGLAIEALKKGKRVARKGWNGKDMWIAYVDGRRTGIATVIFGVEGKNQFMRDNPGLDHVLPFIVLKGVSGQLNTWAPSISDSLSEDWVIVE